MAINDRFMLPKRVRTMEQMADLLAAEQAELDQTQRIIMALENQLTISISTHLLPRHERLFALPVNTAESLEVRRARVLAKLNTRGTTTVQAIRDMVKIITGREADVIEHFSDYAFSILIKLPPTEKITTANMQELAQQVEAVKPAHLAFQIVVPHFLLLPITSRAGPRLSTTRLFQKTAEPEQVCLPAGSALGPRISRTVPNNRLPDVAAHITAHTGSRITATRLPHGAADYEGG